MYLFFIRSLNTHGHSGKYKFKKGVVYLGPVKVPVGLHVEPTLGKKAYD